ncbi:hypothetical protein ACFIJ5_07910 [Haloimpatiens sp. FM7330]|uniref:hypothetical protein n=1 Tax=Haloimpatiens sp. FM7330 TaxID=3298610 RepID=UPI00362BD35D
MKHEKKRIIKIVNEMMNFFFTIGSVDIQIHIEEETNRFIITFKMDYVDGCETRLNELISELNRAKQQEMEEYYWELVGDCDIDTEFSLIGMMVDEARCKIEKDFIEVELIRFKI